MRERLGTGEPEEGRQRQRESEQSARGNPGEGAGPGEHPHGGRGAPSRGLSASSRSRAARAAPQVSAGPKPRGSARAGRGRGRRAPSWSRPNTSVFVFFAAPRSGLPPARPDGPGGTARRAVLPWADSRESGGRGVGGGEVTSAGSPLLPKAHRGGREGAATLPPATHTPVVTLRWACVPGRRLPASQGCCGGLEPGPTPPSRLVFRPQAGGGGGGVSPRPPQFP